MKCTKCGHPDTRTTDTREAKSLNARRRRRVCYACKHRFTTYEMTMEDIKNIHLGEYKKNLLLQTEQTLSQLRDILKKFGFTLDIKMGSVLNGRDK